MVSEAERIQRLYHEKDLTQREIADRLDLTQPAISKKMKNHGIKSDYSGFWTEDEIEKLKENYKDIPYEKVRELFPDRSWNAIKLKAMELGIATPQKEYRNGEEVKQVLRENAEKSKIDIDFERSKELSYILGVIDGDGFHDGKGTIGLETKLEKFADKFASHLESIGFNPGRGKRRGMETVWSSSIEFTNWMKSLSFSKKYCWLKNSGDLWKYIEGAYDSDGDFSHPGPRICSYDDKEKEFLKKVLEYLGLAPSIHTNNVYVPTSKREKFFANVDSVYEKRRP